MASLNKVMLIGHLGRDPEVKSFQNGGKMVNLRLATSESWRDKSSGERKERTEWHSVSVHAEHAVKFAEQYLRKGSMVYIEGQLETRKWQDQQGNDRYSTEVVIRPYGGTLNSLDKRGDGQGGGNRDDRGEDRGNDRRDGGSRGYDQSPDGGAAKRRQSFDDDQDIPF